MPEITPRAGATGKIRHVNRRRRASIDNREALAYVVFREFGCSRDRALRLVDEMIEIVPAIAAITRRAWRRPRRPHVEDLVSGR